MIHALLDKDTEDTQVRSECNDVDVEEMPIACVYYLHETLTDGNYIPPSAQHTQGSYHLASIVGDDCVFYIHHFLDNDDHDHRGDNTPVDVAIERTELVVVLQVRHRLVVMTLERGMKKLDVQDRHYIHKKTNSRKSMVEYHWIWKLEFLQYHPLLDLDHNLPKKIL